MRVLKSTLGFSLLGLMLTGQLQAATTVTGVVNATLTLTSSCLVNGATGATGLDFGNLSFGSTTTFFTEADSQVMADAGGALSIQCSAGTSPVITVGAGSHDGLSTGGTRALSDGNSNYVPYDLYSDSGHNTIVAINGTVSPGASSGAAQTINLYGKAVGKAGLPAGTYSDTINVSLTF